MKALVTGGGGFLGSAIVRRLRDRGDQVTALGRRRYPALEALGIETIQADLSDAAAIERAVAGCDTVFHVAALAGIWGAWRLYWQINVEGTRNVLSACRRAGVARLVYTSSPSVVFTRDSLCGVGRVAAVRETFSVRLFGFQSGGGAGGPGRQRWALSHGGLAAAPDLGPGRSAPDPADCRASATRPAGPGG